MTGKKYLYRGKPKRQQAKAPPNTLRCQLRQLPRVLVHTRTARRVTEHTVERDADTTREGIAAPTTPTPGPQGAPKTRRPSQRKAEPCRKLPHNRKQNKFKRKEFDRR